MLRVPKLAGAAFAVATGALYVGLGWAGQTRSGATTPPATGASKPQAPPLASLYDAGKVELSAPPLAVASSATECDASGNIYVQYSASVEPPKPPYYELNTPLTKISLDSKSTTEFRVPAPEGYLHRYEQGFYVTPRGDVYGLIKAYRHGWDYKEDPNWPDSFVVNYKDDGSVDSLTQLELPGGIHFAAAKLGVFGDGTLLVTGWELSSGPRPTRHIPTKVLTAVFDRAGTYIGPLTLTDDVRQERLPNRPAGEKGQPSPPGAAKGVDSQAGKGVHVPFSQEVGAGIMAGSPDGNIYLIRATSPARVYVVSPGGAVARQFRITPPKPGLVPIMASFGGQGELLMEFSSPPVRDPVPGGPVTALVDPETGDIVQLVAAPSPLTGVLGCLSPQREFLFLRTSEDNHLEVAKFILR